MKSYSLQPIQSRVDAIKALNSTLPGQSAPWLLKDLTGNAIAYFSVETSDFECGMFSICANVSGRHFNKDAEVISVFRRIGEKTGGMITDDWDNQIGLTK